MKPPCCGALQCGVYIFLSVLFVLASGVVGGRVWGGGGGS